jgi:large subunit ribosomal protein L35
VRLTFDSIRFENLACFSFAWLSHRTNVKLSPTSPSISESASDVILPYLPPHPQKGTAYHRYTFFLLAQKSPEVTVVDGQQQPASTTPPTRTIEIEPDDIAERTPFDARAFAQKYNLEPVGVHFYREVWSEEVSKIYEQVLGARAIISPFLRLD